MVLQKANVRSPPVFAREFWRSLKESSEDWQRFSDHIERLWRALADGIASRVDVVLIVSSFALAVWLTSRFVLEPRLHKWAARRWPDHPLGGSLPAVLSVTMHSLVAWVAATALMHAVLWGEGAADVQLRGILSALVATVTLAAFVLAMGRATLRSSTAFGAHGSASQKALAEPLRPISLWLAALLVSIAIVERIVGEVRAGPVVQQVVQFYVAFAFVLVASLALWRLLSVLRSEASKTMERHFFYVLCLIAAVGSLAVAICLLAAAAGYSSFAAFLAKQMVWTAMVLAFFHMLWRLVRDAADATLSSSRGALLRRAHHFGLGARRVQQMVVLIAGVLQFVLGAAGLVLVAAPYGLGPDDLFGRIIGSGGALRIGSLTVSAAQGLRALLVLTIVLLVSRLVTRWLASRLLPTTKLDKGMQNSLTTVTGYVGAVIAISMALTALGIGLDRITWIASALTVGIGFGLQAIVQNFISGLILLAERPIKVGDWVVVGDAEGDVRRINVRATEISLPDRTTVLVPNSELITKAVRNRTFSASEGLVKILLPLPATTDVMKASTLIREVVEAQSGLLERPPPLVQVEDIKDGKIWIGISAYVDGPRQAARIRSELLYELLRRLQADDIALA